MNTAGLKIRRSLPEETSTLTQIAVEAKRYWGYPEHWIKHWESDLTISSDSILYVAEQDGEIRGFYALCVRDNKAALEHLWVKPAFIGTGVGKELFLDAMDRAATLPRLKIKAS